MSPLQLLPGYWEFEENQYSFLLVLCSSALWYNVDRGAMLLNVFRLKPKPKVLTTFGRLAFCRSVGFSPKALA